MSGGKCKGKKAKGGNYNSRVKIGVAIVGKEIFLMVLVLVDDDLDYVGAC